jgi:hypothetical protein
MPHVLSFPNLWRPAGIPLPGRAQQLGGPPGPFEAIRGAVHRHPELYPPLGHDPDRAEGGRRGAIRLWWSLHFKQSIALFLFQPIL